MALTTELAVSEMVVQYHHKWHQTFSRIDSTTLETFKSFWLWFATVPIVRYFLALLQIAYVYLFLNPLAKFYFDGPKLYGWGMWGGDPLPEICAKLLSPPASVWMQPPASDECMRAVYRHFDAFLTSVQLIVYIFIIYRIIQSTTSRIYNVHRMVAILGGYCMYIVRIIYCLLVPHRVREWFGHASSSSLVAAASSLTSLTANPPGGGNPQGDSTHEQSRYRVYDELNRFQDPLSIQPKVPFTRNDELLSAHNPHFIDTLFRNYVYSMAVSAQKSMQTPFSSNVTTASHSADQKELTETDLSPPPEL